MAGVNQSSTPGANPEHIAGTDFVMIHMDLLDELGGDFHAALLFARIQFRAGTDGWWEATRARILEDTRMTEYQFKQALRTLKDAGYVQTERVAAYNATLRYRVIIAATVEKAHSAVSTSDISPPEMANSAVSEMANSAVSTVTKNSEEQQQEPPLPPQGGDVEIVDSSFDEFWKAYPRKDAKKPAQKKWASLIRKHDAGMLIHAAVCYRQWCEREGKANDLILLPTTWMNQERWNDERVNKPVHVEKSNTEHWADLAQELWDNENGSQTSNPLQLEG